MADNATADVGANEVKTGDGDVKPTDAGKTEETAKDAGKDIDDSQISLRPTKVPAGSWRSRTQMAKAEDEGSSSGGKAKGGPKIIYQKDELYAFKDKCTEKPEEDIDELMRAQSKSAAQRNVRRATDDAEISLRPGGTTTFGFATKGPPRLREKPGEPGAPGRGPADRNKTPTADVDFNWREGARPIDKSLLSGVGDDFEALKTSENAWRIIQPTSEEEKVIKKIKGILNKLTPEKFDTLTGQILNAGIESFATLKKVIDLVFDKAVGEPAFCKVYAELCAKLAKELPEFKPSPEEQAVSFKRILLNKCQEEFELHKEAETKIEKLKDLSKEDREVEERKIRMRMLGNIRLIGELFKQRMLTEKIMHDCVMMLLGPKKEEIHEDNLEALCRLMETVGQQMDHEKARPYIDKYFARVKEFSTDQQFSSRIRFMLMDLLDLRFKFKWVPRRKKETQKTIEEIHAEANLERALAGEAPARVVPGARPGPGPSGLGRPGSASDLAAWPAPVRPARPAPPWPRPSPALRSRRPRRRPRRPGRPGTPSGASPVAGGAAWCRGAGVAAGGAAGEAGVGGAGLPGSPKGSITDAVRHLQPAGGGGAGGEKKKLGEAEVRAKAKSYANEYFASGVVLDSALDIKDLGAPAELRGTLVLDLLLASFEKHDKEREMTATLLAECAKQKALDEGDFLKGLNEVAQMLPDLAEDVAPKCYDWFGEFLSRLVDKGALTRACAALFCDKLAKTDDDKLAKLLAKIAPSLKQ
eukprot:tig00021350_g20623.t1